jgi:hypothetical protein
MHDIRVTIRNLTFGTFGFYRPTLKTVPAPKCWTNWRRDLYQASDKEIEESRLYFWIVDVIAHA